MKLTAIPQNAQQFFDGLFKEIFFKEDLQFVEYLKENTHLRNCIYPELDKRLQNWQQWKILLWLTIDCASLMQTERTEQARELTRQAKKLQQEIVKLSEKLADKIDELDELGEQGLISTPYIGSSIRIIINSGKYNYLFKSHLEDDLLKLCHFDSRYMPSISEIIRTLSKSYNEQTIELANNYMDIGKRKSPRDFCIKLHSTINDGVRNRRLPSEFKLTHSEIADFHNAFFEENVISSDNVKTYLSEYRKQKMTEN